MPFRPVLNQVRAPFLPQRWRPWPSAASAVPPPVGDLPAFLAVPTQLDEQNTYDNVLGWAWTAADKTSQFASTPSGTNHGGNIHQNGEADDLWNHYQAYKRTGLQVHLDWAQAWRNYFVTDYFADLQNDSFFEHCYGQGLIFWGMDRNDATALATADQIAAFVEGYVNSLTVGVSALCYWGHRRYARYLLFAVYYAFYNPISRWITMRDKLINCWLQSPDYENATQGSTSGRLHWGGQYFLGDNGADGRVSSAEYAAGRRAYSSFSAAILSEALWRAYLVTGRADVKARLIELAQFAYWYCHIPEHVNPMVGGWLGHENGLRVHYSGNGHTDPLTGSTDCPYDTSQVNTLVYGYKLTGHRGFLRRAHVHLRTGTQYATAAPNATKLADNEVHHYLDTHVDPAPEYFNFNKGEIQYAYQVFENGGVPAREGTFPPYTMPSATPGNVVLIGTNLPRDVRPSTHGEYDWNWGCFGYYGGGVLCEDYSVGGAWVVAGSGGHGVPPNLGALIFDFQDATWKRKDNANNVAWRNTDYDISELTGGVINGSSPEMMAPSHLYANISQRRRGQGGGTQGSFLVLRVAAASTSGNTGNAHAWAFNLATGLWTRLSTNASLHSGDSTRTSAYDPQTGRYYLLRYQLHNSNNIDYLDQADWTWKNVNMGGQADLGQNYTCFIDEARHLLVVWASTENLRVMDLDNIAGGFTTVPKSGPHPSAPQSDQSEFCLNPRTGVYYCHLGGGLGLSSTIYKLTPPAIGSNPLTSTWVFSTLITSQPLQPIHDDYIVSGAAHNKRFFYVPSLDCFAWIPGDNHQVALIRP